MTAPLLSVVVVPFCGPPALRRCLAALSNQAGAPAMEVLVPCDERLEGALPPSIRVVRSSGRRTWAQLRARGVAHARGAVVALLEDHCAPRADWAANVVAAHRAPDAAIGGVLDKQTGSALNWALFLLDYGRYLPPVREGPATYLTDCNVSYKRAALEAVNECWVGEFHETSVHWALQARGDSCWLSPAMVVDHDRPMRLGPALFDRLMFGRLFASTRVRSLSSAQRAVYALGALVLPGILVARAVVTALRKRRDPALLIRVLPAMAVLAVAWSLGEACGYVTGVANRSLRPKRPAGERVDAPDLAMR